MDNHNKLSSPNVEGQMPAESGLSAPTCSASSNDQTGLDEPVNPVELTLEQMQEVFKDSKVGRKIVKDYNTEVKLTVSKELAEKLFPNFDLEIDNDL